MNKKRLKDTVLRNDHYRMERFGVLFIVFVVAFLLIYIFSMKISHDKQKTTFTNQVLYTSDTMPWSLSHGQMTVKEVYRNPDNTKALILFYTANKEDIPSLKSTSYRVFISGVNDTKITHDILGSWYIFGGTGYMALSLYDTQGFEEAIANIIIRDKSYVETDSKNTYDGIYENADSTFHDHNQLQFNMNLCGKDAKSGEFLDIDDISPADLYANTVAQFDMEELKKTLDDDVNEFNKNLIQIMSARDELVNYGFTDMPSIPACIAQDAITHDALKTVDNPVFFNEKMMNMADSIISSDYASAVVEDESSADDNDDENKSNYLVTKFVFPGGIQINHQDVKITSDYLSTIFDGEDGYEKWLANTTTEFETYGRRAWYTDNTTDWVRNGTAYAYRQNKNSATSMFDTAIDDYNKAIQSAINCKIKYQTVDLPNVLAIADVAESMNGIADVNTEKELVTVWGKG